MKGKGLFRFIKEPEFQFFILFTVLATGTFVLNYIYLPKDLKEVAIIAFVLSVFIVFMETMYSLQVHKKMKEEENNFINVTAHQMRTPLTAVRWALTEMGKADMGEKEKADLANVSKIAVQRLSNIVSDFNDIAKIESGGQFDYEFKPTKFVEFIERMVHEATPVAKQYKVTLSFEKPNNEILCKVDPAKMSIVFSNLINNGIKYNKENGVVVVKVRQPMSGDHIEVVIEDSGMGVTEEEKRKLFTKFFRAEQAKRRNPAGSGLGLYLAKNIVKRHGGKIWIHSVIGKGTAFHFTLPLGR